MPVLRWAAAVAAGSVLFVTACDADPGSLAPAAAAPGATSASGPAGGATAATSGAAGPASSTPVPVTAGPLSEANVPPPASIGSTWTTNAEPAPDAHGQTDASWLSARDPADVAASLAPLGCTGLTAAPRYPVPAHALQGRYVSAGGLNAVVLVLDYPDEASATALMSGMARDIATCPPRASVGPQTPYTRAITVAEASTTRIRDQWTESGVGAGPNVWHEVVVRVGTRVGLADVEAPPGVTPDLATVSATLDRTVRG